MLKLLLVQLKRTKENVRQAAWVIASSAPADGDTVRSGFGLTHHELYALDRDDVAGADARILECGEIAVANGRRADLFGKEVDGCCVFLLVNVSPTDLHETALGVHHFNLDLVADFGHKVAVHGTALCFLGLTHTCNQTVALDTNALVAHR